MPETQSLEKEDEISRMRKFLSSIILILLFPLFSLIILFKSTLLQLLWFWGDNEGEKRSFKKWKLNVSYFHFSNTRMRNIFQVLTNFYFGSVLGFCFHCYVLTQTPFSEWGNLYSFWFFFVLGVYGLFKTPLDLINFKNKKEKEKPIWSKVVGVFKNICWQNVCSKIRSFFHCKNESSSPSWFKKNKHTFWLLILAFLLLLNAVYNIGTMAILASYLWKKGSIFWWIPLAYYLPTFFFPFFVCLFFLDCGKGVRAYVR